jgi:hypothetical protein
MIATQQSQTMIVESCVDKCCKSEAKFDNNMLQLLLVGEVVDSSFPGTLSMNLSFQTTGRQ